MAGQVYWNPAPLTAAIERAYQASIGEAAADAQAHAPSHKAGAQVVPGGIQPTGLGVVFEGGRHGGYPIQPKGRALKFKDGGFAASAVGGPMAPRPYIMPAAVRWAHAGFQMVARRFLMSAGFR